MCMVNHKDSWSFGYETPMVHYKGDKEEKGCCNSEYGKLNELKIATSLPIVGTFMAGGALALHLFAGFELPPSGVLRLAISAIPVVNTCVLVPADIVATAIYHAKAYQQKKELEK